MEELNRAVNSANSGVAGYTERSETYKEEGFKDLTGEASGLFDMQDLPGYTEGWSHWLASGYASYSGHMNVVTKGAAYVTSYYNMPYGIRPVIVLPSDIEFKDVNEDGMWEIVDVQ